MLPQNILRKNLPLESTLLKDISCLSPTVRNKDWTICATGRLAERFSHVIKEWKVSVIKDQWVFYQKEKVPNEWYQDSLIKNVKRQDSYWSKIFDKNQKLVQKIWLTKLVKNCLLLHNENASVVERSLSDNKNTLIVERTKFKDSTLLALRKTKEHARFCEVLVVSVHLRKISEKV